MMHRHEDDEERRRELFGAKVSGRRANLREVEDVRIFRKRVFEAGKKSVAGCRGFGPIQIGICGAESAERRTARNIVVFGALSWRRWSGCARSRFDYLGAFLGFAHRRSRDCWWWWCFTTKWVILDRMGPLGDFGVWGRRLRVASSCSKLAILFLGMQPSAAPLFTCCWRWEKDNRANLSLFFFLKYNKI